VPSAASNIGPAGASVAGSSDVRRHFAVEVALFAVSFEIEHARAIQCVFSELHAAINLEHEDHSSHAPAIAWSRAAPCDQRR
jgi:hypothetical protein